MIPDEWLPSDVLYEILVRQSVKTLCKFRCVSKKWRSLISSTSFQQDHYRHSSAEEPLLILTKCEYKELNGVKTNTLYISTCTSQGNLINKFCKTGLQQVEYVSIQSCLGLVCLAPKYRTDPIIICNPSTEELIVLPPGGGKHECIGFGYATLSEEFKVVNFFRHPEFPNSRLCCEVLTLGATGWREAHNSPPQYSPSFFMWGAPFLRGALHLLLDSLFIPEDIYPCIDVFNIETEEYTKISLPERFHTADCLRYIYLTELRGSLCLTFDYIDDDMEIWCLRDYDNNEWAKQYTIDLSLLGPCVDDMFSDYWISANPLAIMRDGSMMMDIRVEDETSDETSIYYYSFESNEFTKDTNANCSGSLNVESLFGLGNMC